VTIQDLGSIGELVAAIATVVTLVYLAVQVRQNTRALRSSTFQDVSREMAHNVEPIVYQSDVAEILVKGLRGLAELTPSEQLRFRSVLVMSFRRMEAVYVHSKLGSIERELALGFELSMLSMLHNPGAAEWWGTAKATFTRSFSEHVDSWLAENKPSGIHPSMGFSTE